MTLRLSPKQVEIIEHLKVPKYTPEDYAKLKGISINTVNAQLSRIRAKDKEARVFRATLNGLIGRYPQLRQWLKPKPELTEAERALVERRLQNPNELRLSAGRQGQKGRQRGRMSQAKKRLLVRKRRSVK